MDLTSCKVSSLFMIRLFDSWGTGNTGGADGIKGNTGKFTCGVGVGIGELLDRGKATRLFKKFRGLFGVVC